LIRACTGVENTEKLHAIRDDALLVLLNLHVEVIRSFNRFTKPYALFLICGLILFEYTDFLKFVSFGQGFFGD
jgi:hypothetical protein